MVALRAETTWSSIETAGSSTNAGVAPVLRMPGRHSFCVGEQMALNRRLSARLGSSDHFGPSFRCRFAGAFAGHWPSQPCQHRIGACAVAPGQVGAGPAAKRRPDEACPGSWMLSLVATGLFVLLGRTTAARTRAAARRGPPPAAARRGPPRVRQMSSHSTLGGPARAPGATARPERRHPHARSRVTVAAARTPDSTLARLVMLAGVIWRSLVGQPEDGRRESATAR